ncbi:winged helix-turn-helix domain-containing protein [Alicyclobacillus sendaiensis]|uniref:winged helix-turn-helix domain-containing protein n=1 Tax=Alicyclobacillus sendaiensis TaxID=192387 RepID=UPI0034CF31D9
MVRRALREEDWRRATDASLAGFLFAPVPVCLCRLQDENWLKHLVIPPSETARNECPEIPVGPSVTYLPHLRAVKISTDSGDDQVDLTLNESSLLQLFLQNPNRIISRQEISALIWRGIAHPASVATLVGRLRNKLGPAGKCIAGRRQGGYIYHKPE